MIAAWFTALGHMVRDGWPKLPTTFLARLAGGLAAAIGAWCITDWMMAAALGLAVLAGFYTDLRHGEANRGAWVPGIISGTSSIAPIAVTAAMLSLNPWWLGLAVAGVAKPPIWRAAWWLDPGRFASRVPAWAAPLFEPTRVAAILWGVLVGALITVIGVSVP